MFKTNKRVSREAELLYTEHKNIAESIEDKQNYINSAERMKAAMAGSSIVDTVRYNSSMDLDISFVKADIEERKTVDLDNQTRAIAHLALNPKLFDIAVKDAKNEGVKINLDPK